MVELPVIKAFTHEGRTFSVGDTITVEPIVAAVLHRQGKVSLTKGYRTASLAVGTNQYDDGRDAPLGEPLGEQGEPGQVAKPKRRYRRRDMTSEPS